MSISSGCSLHLSFGRKKSCHCIGQLMSFLCRHCMPMFFRCVCKMRSPWNLVRLLQLAAVCGQGLQKWVFRKSTDETCLRRRLLQASVSQLGPSALRLVWELYLQRLMAAHLEGVQLQVQPRWRHAVPSVFSLSCSTSVQELLLPR